MVISFDSSLGTPPLDQAIDRHPLIVSPDTPLEDVAALMHQTANLAHFHPTLKEPNHSLCGARSSCVLVMHDQELLGIFTERDLVQLTALEVSMQSTRIKDVMHHPVLSMTEEALHNVFAALFLFRRHQIRHLAIVNHPHQLVGVVSLDSIRHILRPTNLLKIRRVAEVMTHSVIAATPTDSVLHLTELMAAHRISCVVIVEPFMNENSVHHPIGIVTERDVVHFQAMGLDLHQTQAQTVMSTPLFVLSPEDSLWTAHQEMEKRQVRRLVVSWNWGKNLGIITQTSLLRVFDPIEMHDVIETLQRTIQKLGLDPDKILAASIDHDAHFSVSQCSIYNKQLPDITEFLKGLQTQLQHLVNCPDLPSEARQTALLTVISDLQDVQASLQQ
jgi:signal-transduction protein with cAMP-binding, CBS, and nucleotidyltransferase domain